MYGQEWAEEKIERHLAAASLIPFGISYLDDALLGIMPNDLMLVGARTGRGKTELATTIAFNAAARGRDVVFFALEADKWEIQRRMKYRKLAQLWQQHFANTAAGSQMKFPRYREWLVQGYDPQWDGVEKEAERELAQGTTSLRVVYKGAKYSAEQFVRDLEGLDETQLIIVDHLHYFDLVGNNETDGLKRAIHAIRNAALHHAKPVLLLAHLRKSVGKEQRVLPGLDDFHGHSDIAKVSTTVLLMAPAAQHPGIGAYPTYFHIAKCRTAAEVTPYAAVMGFDYATNCYTDRYHLEAASFFDDPKPIERADQFPDWARRAIKPMGTPMKERYDNRR